MRVLSRLIDILFAIAGFAAEQLPVFLLRFHCPQLPLLAHVLDFGMGSLVGIVALGVGHIENGILL